MDAINLSFEGGTAMQTQKMPEPYVPNNAPGKVLWYDKNAPAKSITLINNTSTEASLDMWKIWYTSLSNLVFWQICPKYPIQGPGSHVSGLGDPPGTRVASINLDNNTVVLGNPLDTSLQSGRY